jgi:hypothetical protein
MCNTFGGWQATVGKGMAARSMTQTPKSRLVLLASAGALVASLATAPPGWAAGPFRVGLISAGLARSAPVIDASTVMPLSDPGVELTGAADGHLRGDGIALVVTGAALTNGAGQGGQAVSAGPGRHLIVFGLRQIPQPAPTDAPPAALALVVSGQRRKVDLAALSASHQGYFAASIADGTTKAVLELSAAGFTQDFDLMTMRRPGPDPVVLYRDADNADAATTLDAAVNVAATVPTDPGYSYTDTITVPTVTLSYFAPISSADPAPGSDRAYLEINATEKPVVDKYGEHFVHFSAPVPASHFHLVLPDGTTASAAHTGCVCDDPDNKDYVVDGTYYFVVPANMTAATLKVDPYQGDGFEYIVATASHQTISLAGFSIPLVLNAPAPAPPATTPVTVLKLTGPAAGASASPGATAQPGHGASRAPLGVVLILLAAAGAVGWTAVQRRRRRAPLLPAGTGHRTGPEPPRPAWSAQPAPNGGHVPPDHPEARPTAGSAGSFPLTHLLPAAPSHDQAADSGLGGHPGRTERPGPASPGSAAPPVTSQVTAGVAPVAATGPTAAVSVAVLGPRLVTGPGTTKLRPRDLEVFLFLAVNRDRAVTNDDIRAAVAGAADDESSANTVRTWLSRLRSAVGPAVLPEADNGRYRVAGVEVDIDHFQQLTTQAAAASDAAAAARLLTEALELVRGRPFEGLDYRWTAVTAAHLETGIANAAHRLAELAWELHSPDTAAWAAQQGLAGLTQPDDRLLSHLLYAGSADGPGRLTQAWREVTARYAAVGDAPGPELVAVYDRLRSQRVQR